jgi:DNA-binding MarR family transcriptional regulator
MTNESCISALSFQQNIENMCKNNSKNLGKEIFSLKFRVLIEIFTYKKVSPTEIKNELVLAKSNVAKFCKMLVDEGKIESIPDKKDHRAIFYSLTKKGEKYIENCLSEFSKIVEQTFGENVAKKIETEINKIDDIFKTKRELKNVKNN